MLEIIWDNFLIIKYTVKVIQIMTERKYIMSVMKIVYKCLFDTLISKTPESWQTIRNFFVKKYIKNAGGGG